MVDKKAWFWNQAPGISQNLQTNWPGPNWRWRRDETRTKKRQTYLDAPMMIVKNFFQKYAIVVGEFWAWVTFENFFTENAGKFSPAQLLRFVSYYKFEKFFPNFFFARAFRVTGRQTGSKGVWLLLNPCKQWIVSHFNRKLKTFLRSKRETIDCQHGCGSHTCLWMAVRKIVRENLGNF